MPLIFDQAKEKEILSRVSGPELMRHLETVAAEERLSGSPGEARAVEYFQEFMTGLGLKAEIKRHEALVSLPLKAGTTVIWPERKDLPCLTHSLAASTPLKGVEAEVTRHPQDGAERVRGRIALRDGLASPGPCLEMAELGAAGVIFVNSGDLPHNMCVSSVWGMPAPDTAGRLLNIPVVSLARREGEYLKGLLARGVTRVILETEVLTEFRSIPLAVADLEGAAEPELFVLFNGHVDSWHQGAMDNGTGNAVMLELARVLAEHRGELRRGVRFAWWSGHSHGRYAGSNWYADHHWEELHGRAIVHLNADCLGAAGASDYSEVEGTAECFTLGRSVIELVTGQKASFHRIGRSGDNSFWGVGLPTLFQLLSRQPRTGAEGPDVLIPGLPWFWHTEADTLDKIDPAVLLTDARIFAAALWRLTAAPVIPFDFVPVAEEFLGLISQLQAQAGSAFDLRPALDLAGELKTKAAALEKAAGEVAARCLKGFDPIAQAQARRLNRLLMKLSRILIPVNYSAEDPFTPDPALPVPALPRLRPLAQLAGLDPAAPAFKYLERRMVRERNRVVHALAEAGEAVDRGLIDL